MSEKRWIPETLFDDLGFRMSFEVERVLYEMQTEHQHLVLFNQKFYAACQRCLTPGGVMVTQNGVPIFQPGELVSSVRKFRKLFADGSCYVAAIPTYVGGHMAMGWATANRKLRQIPARMIAERYSKAGSFSTKYWTPEVHVAAFALPRFIVEHVARAG